MSYASAFLDIDAASSGVRPAPSPDAMPTDVEFTIKSASQDTFSKGTASTCRRSPPTSSANDSARANRSVGDSQVPHPFTC